MEATGGINDRQSVSVIMPAFNEEENIADAVAEVQAKVFSTVPKSQLIVVDGGSSDRTVELLQAMAKSDNRIVPMQIKGCPHGPSLIEGMKVAQGDYILLVDSDMQIPLDCFPLFWQTVQQCDGVFASRRNRQDPLARLVLSSVIRATTLALYGTDAKDANAPCKLFRRSIWEEFRKVVPEDDILAPSIMINIFARKRGYRIQQIPVEHRARAKGESTLKLARLSRACLQGLKQLLRFKKALT